MTKLEFEESIRKEKLIQIHDGRNVKTYIDANQIYNEDGEWTSNEVNVYGCFQSKKSGEFIIFITDEERGIPTYISKYKNAEDAYAELYKKIARLERIYIKKYCLPRECSSN